MSPLREQLKIARKARKLSQKQLGQGLGWAQAHVSEIESGRVDPRLSSVIQMSRLVDQELMLVPRTLVPAVQALLSGQEEKSLWSVEDDEESNP
jgi:predicted transcriptional regulator